MTLRLSERDSALLDGEGGEAAQTAMRILTSMARVYGAESLLEISSAHVDSCLYHGLSGLDFAERLVDQGARVRVPTTLNVGSVDLLHPEYFRGTKIQAERGRRLMECYREMGCRPVWTCAPYQDVHRPELGAQIAWAESNAIVFANSVLGARTNRYGDFIDICAAITGRAPATGLHLDRGRVGDILFRLRAIPDSLLASDAFYPVLGYLIGRRCGSGIPVIEGLPAHVSEDRLKALGAAAASSGAVALFHAVGVTPEAPTLEAAFGGEPPRQAIEVTPDLIRKTRDQLSTAPDGPIRVVALGSPHFSLAEFSELVPLVRSHRPSPEVEFFVCTSRLVCELVRAKGWLGTLEEAGIRVVADTCVVVTPLIEARSGALMTNSGKFAYYTPGNTGLSVIFGSLKECVRSAATGEVWRDPSLWG